MPLQQLRTALHEEHRETYVKYAKERNKLLSRMTCLVPGCACQAINSHSQQRAVALKAIAENNHVYALKRSTTFCSFCSVGIREASTFKGFCAKHDAELFAELELSSLEPGNPIQIQQAFLRAIAHECVRKKETALAIAAVSKKEGGPDYAVSDIWLSFPEIEAHFQNALAGTLRLGWLWMTVPANLGVAMTSAFSLPKNNKWVAFDEHFIATATIIPTVGGVTHLIFSWPATHHDKSRHLRRLLKDNWGFALNALVFYMSEDYSLSPSLLSDEAKAKAIAAWHTYPPVQPSSVLHFPRYTTSVQGVT